MTTQPQHPAPDPTTGGNPLWLGLRWLIAPLMILLIWWAIPLLAPTAPLAWLTTSQAAWYLSRASGSVAYLLMSFSMVWGLLLSGKWANKRISPAIGLAVHNYLSWTAIGFTVFHAAVLLFDGYYRYTLATLLIPFIGPYSPLWVGIGIIGFYVMLATSASWFFRKQIGQKTWRKLHFLTFAAYLSATLHGLMAGTDTTQLLPMYGVSAAVVLFLTFYRITTAVRKV